MADLLKRYPKILADGFEVRPRQAFAAPRIVADATLHRDAQGWFRHVGRIRLALDPAARLQGLARALVREFAQLAGPLGLTRLETQVLDVHVYTLEVLPDGSWAGPVPWAEDEADLGRV